MWWSRLLPCALAAVLIVGPPCVATGAALGNQQEVPDARGGEETDVTGDVEPETDRDPDSPPEPDPESDSDGPLLLLVTTDAKSVVYVDGRIEGQIEPGEKLEVRVDLGEIAFRATSVDVPGAAWDKTLEFEEPSAQAVRIRMKKAIRLFRRQERKTGVFRDRKTELMWPKRDNAFDVDLRRAYAYCRDLPTGGFEDWRLPTLGELESLEAIWQVSGYKILGEIALTECCMWSSDYDGTERAWTFNYRFRKAFQTNAGYAIGLRALCVREWNPEAEPEVAPEADAAGEKPG